jgi:cytochrome c-type biogenesis protein
MIQDRPIPDPVASPPRRVTTRRRLALAIGGLAAVLGVGLLAPAGAQTGLQSAIGSGNSLDLLLTLALPVYLTGMLSLLSPCCLPILPAYFSVTFGADRQRVVAMSIAFFLGLATTMVVLGASLTAVSALLFPYRTVVTQIGGIIIIGFGLMSILGKGFTGMQIRERPTATLAGTFVYGMTFAFGWTACVGPILGAVLTALVTTGLSVLAGAILAFVYALGLATPLTLLAAFFGRVGRGTRMGAILRGRGFTVRVAGRTLYLHSTSLVTGVLLILVGYMLVSGQLAWFTQRMASGVGTRMALATESWLARIFSLGY